MRKEFSVFFFFFFLPAHRFRASFSLSFFSTIYLCRERGRRRVTRVTCAKDRSGKEKKEREKETERGMMEVAALLLEGQIICLSGALVRTNKWKQIISWPHYEKKSMASLEDLMCAVGVAVSLSLTFSLSQLATAAPGRQ